MSDIFSRSNVVFGDIHVHHRDPHSVRLDKVPAFGQFCLGRDDLRRFGAVAVTAASTYCVAS